jgi:hypothetical protein
VRTLSISKSCQYGLSYNHDSKWQERYVDILQHAEFSRYRVLSIKETIISISFSIILDDNIWQSSMTELNEKYSA